MNGSNSVVPDPTEDLKFSEWRGAIHDIFAQNTAQFPERPCVLETASQSAPAREFSYRQIWQASNVLAHHLLQHGIKREDVVMIYAYRGVDLVIAVMGVLAAGATFSVVDPAYPPDRQIVYLDVARPRALIVIEKASREDGELSSAVRSWAMDNLELRTEIPALRLLDNGVLQGGTTPSSGQDVLLSQQDLGTKRPGVIVGPDSRPTLSFTSGSEGKPKGVCGRHFSLTHYQPWMKARFELSKNDRFTMLSGIAHDPIQRDIFTPLFLGALILIPPKEVIRHVELAEWMREHRATVTHTTPAMGQILIGGASAKFDALRRIFFVGDVLMKRDCKLLQNLANNARIVNMYGTTETQRAVSYYEVPSRNEDPHFLDQMGDVIPAGKGMSNVQLLVVDRTSLEKGKPEICPVGEIGEVFVRAGGLAEGYLSVPELTKQKFIPNFFLKDPDHWNTQEQVSLTDQELKEPWREFWKGPRDRLYRSGDLGRYTASGDVECTGRADSQVKIRGFRIELGEIDTHLSKHPFVQENVTLVRREAGQEPYLVSYIVPDFQKWPSWLEGRGVTDDVDDETMSGLLKRFRILREDAKILLRSKLPYYAVPSIIIPLKNFPLTPNYKVDKRQLPYPNEQELAAAMSKKRTGATRFTDTQQEICEIWASRLRNVNTDAIDLDDRFVDLGGHSMIGQEVLFDVRKRKGIILSMNTLFQNPSLQDFASVIDAALEVKDATGEASDSSPPEMDYALDGEVLRHSKAFPKQFPSGLPKDCIILLTGVTGFLGTTIMQRLLQQDPQAHIFALVRAKSPLTGLERIRTASIAYGNWSASWTSRITCLDGDLTKEKLGLAPEVWAKLESSVDVVIHNGARVHWIHTYSTLKEANVISTLECLRLCSVGMPKRLVFISSTSVLDSPGFVKQTVSELDDLSRSRKGLPNGYAQTKYVSEYLVRQAGSLGLSSAIVRPGYIMGSPSNHGIGPTDDFLLRMLKGSIQLRCRPDLNKSTINMVPVSYCADVIIAAAFTSSASASLSPSTTILHVTPHSQTPFNDFLSTLEVYGYTAPQVPYPEWRTALEKYVSTPAPAAPTSSTLATSSATNDTTKQTQDATEQSEPHALLPLFDWVTDDLPRDTQSVLLDDTNTQAVLKAQAQALSSKNEPGREKTGHESGVSSSVTSDLVGMYLGYMLAIGFIPAPPPESSATSSPAPSGLKIEKVPVLDLSLEQRDALKVVGRGGN